MAGVIKKKKVEREERIFTAAIALFQENGFTATSMKEIAAKADLGVGTLYNYFKSKNDLLLEINERKLNHIIENEREAIYQLFQQKNPPQGILKEISRHFLEYLLIFDKEILVEMMKAFLSSKKLLESGKRMDLKILSMLENILKLFQDKKQLKETVNIHSAAFTVYSVILFQIMLYVFFPEMDDKKLMENVNEQIDIIFNGLKY